MLLDDAATAAEKAQGSLSPGSESMGLVYVAIEPPEDGPVNLIYAPYNQLRELFLLTTLPLPDAFYPGERKLPVAVIEREREGFFAAIENIRESRSKHLQGRWGNKLAVDTLFLNRNIAFAVALQHNLMDIGHPNISGLQVCYYEGDPIDGAPENLVNISSGDIVDFFTHTRLRIPVHLVIPPGVAEQDKTRLKDGFKQLRKEVLANRETLAGEYLKKCAVQQPPAVESGQPLRIFFPANRMTEVMQYASKGLAEGFKALGHEVRVSIEQNEMEQLDYQRPKEQYEFNPHLVVKINHLDNQWMHPDLFNMVWWQDPMPELTNGAALPWRQRDLVYVIGKDLGEYAINSGAKDFEFQPIAVDEALFKPYSDVQREDKIVFAGSSHLSVLPDHPMMEQILASLQMALESGRSMGPSLCHEISEKLDVSFDLVWKRAIGHVVRESLVRWICHNPTVKVEVYGYGWEQDPVVAPYFKGEVAHGEELARIYSSAKYALAINITVIGDQRFTEICACGAIPVVYDCRDVSPNPH